MNSCVYVGTPDDKVWPGVSELPDYKSSFPKWPIKSIDQVIPNLCKVGQELVSVSNTFFLDKMIRAQLTLFVFESFYPSHSLFFNEMIKMIFER